MDLHSLQINSGIQPDHKQSSLLNFENRYPGNFFDGIRDLAEKVAVGDLPTYTFLCGKPGSGKCLGRGTLVVLYDGTLRAVEDIRIGDMLLGPDSMPRCVLGITSGVGNLYEVSQRRGVSYIVNEEHVLCLQKRHGRKSFAEEIQIPVKDFLKISAYKKSSLLGYRVAVDFGEKALAIDSYFLGLWLGDGDQNRLAITKPDKEIIFYIHDYAQKLGLAVSKYQYKEDQCPTWRIRAVRRGYSNKLKDAFNDLGLFYNKHIPHEYLCSSLQQRRELLAGLIDSDGHIDGQCCCIVQKRKELTFQIQYLCNSLGLRCYITKKVMMGRDYWVASITGRLCDIPMRVERKKVISFSGNHDHRVTAIKIKAIGTGEYFGFETDRDHRFLLSDFTVTHNSHALVGMFRARAFIDDGLIGGDHGLYIPFANLTTEIISTFSDGGSMRISLAKYLSVQYLFLDDISRGEKITDPSRMESQMLRDILLDRWENNRHLICTCNYDPAGLQRMIKNVFGEYVHSRVMGSSLFIEFPDKDFRKEQGEKNEHVR